MTAKALSREEAFARIRLLRSPNVGPVSYAQLLRRFGSAVEAVAALPDLARRGGRRYEAASAARIEREIEATRRAGARYLFHDMEEYPALLAQMDGAPPIVTLRGNIALALRPCVAMVGARNASAAAVRLAREFAATLGEAGIVVVSGLARGIDGAAHEASLATGTIGVIASGIDIAYPPEHADLQERIATGGLLIAEEPPGTDPLARHFPKRNRIIAGLAAGTIVVEAAPKSGSLITARLAGEAGREVMAIPGSPLDSRAHGCNQLIRDGAVLVQSAQDVLELISGFDGQPKSRFRDDGAGVFDLPEAEPEIDPGDIAALLSPAPVAIDELVRQSGTTAATVQGALLDLELAGRLVRHAGGRVSLQD
ncbi:DNA-processing protein DprA [Novosphingobium sp. ZN18A2]|uniref:DNA-processing protein DprA n=1 Tax=Novosphingobium sp. ZN18A2 TaxID=3079861 RepID=UPI0030D58331